MQGGYNAFLLCVAGSHLAVAEYLAPKMEGHLFDSDDDGYIQLLCRKSALPCHIVHVCELNSSLNLCVNVQLSESGNCKMCAKH